MLQRVSMTKKNFLLCIAFAWFGNSAFADAHLHWAYAGKEGPANWGMLGDEYAACKTGTWQAPIDIPVHQAIRNDSPITPRYKPSAGEVANNGHTIQIGLIDGGSVALLGKEYPIVQFHFHTPAEEKLAGKRYPLNAHLVHKSADGKIAVIGVFFKIGAENPALKTIFLTMPFEEVSIPLQQHFDLGNLLPSTLSYYRYDGSLTMPPCSEGVTFYILKTPLELSQRQLQAFQKLFPMNARPVMPVNGRMIFVSR